MIPIVAMLVALQAGAPAASAPPDWQLTPSGADIAHVYPDKAQLQDIEGAARIACGVTPEGRMQDCRIVAELPRGYGFGDAALKLAPRFKMKRLDPAMSETSIAIRFTLPMSNKPGAKFFKAMFCYGRAYEAVEKARRSTLAWNRLNYWSGQVLVGVANSGYPPSEYEAALAFGRLPLSPGVTPEYMASCEEEGPKS